MEGLRGFGDSDASEGMAFEASRKGRDGFPRGPIVGRPLRRPRFMALEESGCGSAAADAGHSTSCPGPQLVTVPQTVHDPPVRDLLMTSRLYNTSATAEALARKTQARPGWVAATRRGVTRSTDGW